MIDCDEFVKDYNKLSVDELRKKYEISRNEYVRLKKELNLGKKKRIYYDSLRKGNPKYYYKNKNRYIVHKTIDGKTEYYTSCYSEETAKKTVEMFKQCNWDKSRINEIKEKLDYDGDYLRWKYNHIDFDEFKEDCSRISMEDILSKHKISKIGYEHIKNMLGLGRKKRICNTGGHNEIIEDKG